jgi:DNA-binding NtrC family response regulator
MPVLAKSFGWRVSVKDQLDSLINQMIEQGVHFEDAIGEFQKRFIQKVLERNDGNKLKTAQRLGIHRNTLSRKLEEIHSNHRRPVRRKQARSGRRAS